MNRIFKSIMALALIMPFAVSCSLSEIPAPSDFAMGDLVRVQIRPSIQGMDEPTTKSSVSWGDSQVRDINIFFYRDGKLAASNYVQSPAVASILLVEGESYNAYALANVGQVTPVDSEEQFKKYCFRISSEKSFVDALNDGGIPMAWHKEDYRVSRSVTELPLALVRLVSKIRFRVDKQALAGLEVTSIRICNAAGAVTPFEMNGHGGSKITSSTDVINGDYSSQDDLSVINAGGQIYFYALENCQGRLLPGNLDPWKKTPENIDDAALCTYLEVNCRFQSGFALNGTIVYRVYLGQDNCTNFDIIRNVDMGVTLCLTRNLDNVSWKIDPDVDYNGALGEAMVSAGYHTISEMYVGETLQLYMQFNEYLIDYLGDGLQGCRLAARIDDQESECVQFGELTGSGVDYYCDVKGLKPTQEPLSLWLVDRDGKYVTDVTLLDDDINVFLPSYAIGDGSVRRVNQKIGAPRDYPCPVMNGDDDIVYLYLVDRMGNNLNVPSQDGQYKFDLSFYKEPVMSCFINSDLSTVVNPGSARYINNCYKKARVERGGNMNGDPAFKFWIKCSNAGNNSILNEALSQIYHYYDYHTAVNNLVDLTFSSSDAMSAAISADFEIIKPTVYFGSSDTFPASNGFTLGGKSYIALSNPSFIDLKADAFYVGRRMSGSTVFPSSASLVNYALGMSGSTSYFGDFNPSYGGLGFAASSSAVLKNTALSGVQDITLKGEACKLYRIDTKWGVDALAMADPEKGYVRGEVGISTVSGRMVYYQYEDLNGGCVASNGTVVTDPIYNYNWGDNTYSYRGTGWYVGENLSSTIVANADNNIANMYLYSARNVYRVMRDSPVQFTLGWNTTYKSPELKMSGNTTGAKFKVCVAYKYESTCSTKTTSTASSASHTWTVKVPEGIGSTGLTTYSISGESYTLRLPGYTTIEAKFADINKNYWYETCDALINTKSSRYSQMAMPQGVTIYVSIFVEENGVWIPIKANLSSSTATVTASYTSFYTNTAKGTYADNSSMTNPDGSSRGKDSSANSQAVKYSDYTKGTAKYSVSMKYVNLGEWHRYE